ncbi:RNA polymerase subunit sigma-70 [Hyalangium versicolor]|uniref:RNA polymerase subunit sigma-70 n=1 Tax=Hyalangium versicolor TaxID=2861190 RepID=UPI001CC9010C|nr:RNA polymerase subunit sigma-70 [Hyalangium versicolor]
MEESLKLAVTFLEHASVRVAVPGDGVELEGVLLRAWETARGPWPQVALPAELFVKHLARHLPETSDGNPLATVLEELALADLYLACACVQQVPEAVEAMERHCLAKLPGLMGYLKLPDAVLDDVCQMVRIQLLLGSSEAGPRLADYTGRGALLSWVRVIAVRLALKQAPPGRAAPEDGLLSALEALPSPETDAELDLVKRRYRPMFLQAIRESFDALSSEQRHLLRLHVIDRLPTTRLGPLFGVDQSTVSRWIIRAREAVYEETKRRLKERLRLSSREFDSLTDAIDSQLDLSLSQLLKDDEPEKPEPDKDDEPKKPEAKKDDDPEKPEPDKKEE